MLHSVALCYKNVPIYCAVLPQSPFQSFFSFPDFYILQLEKDMGFVLNLFLLKVVLCLHYLFIPKEKRYFYLNLTVIMHFDKSTHCSLTLNLKLRVNAVHQGPRNMLMCKCTKNFSLFF